MWLRNPSPRSEPITVLKNSLLSWKRRNLRRSTCFVKRLISCYSVQFRLIHLRSMCNRIRTGPPSKKTGSEGSSEAELGFTSDTFLLVVPLVSEGSGIFPVLAAMRNIGLLLVSCWIYFCYSYLALARSKSSLDTPRPSPPRSFLMLSVLGREDLLLPSLD